MSRPIKFCMLATFYPPASFGGDAIQVQRLSRALADRGHSVTVVASGDAYSTLSGKRVKPEDDHPGVHVIPIDSFLGSLSPLTTYLTGRPLLTRGRIESALDAQYDVLHFHNPSLLGGPALLKMGSGVKLYTAHEHWLVCPTHVLWKYNRRVCESPQCWRCNIVYRRPPQLWRESELLESSLAHIDALIVPSRSSALLHQRFKDLVRIEHLAHFVMDPMESAQPEVKAEHRAFLFVGRLESIKGVEVLLEAFGRRPSDQLIIAGSGALEKSLRRRAADLENVHFLGWIGASELSALYRRSLAVIVPTLGHESFGLVAVEALAHGTPVIVHRFGALAELMKDADAGFTYASEQELHFALDTLSGDAKLRRELGRRGREAYLRLWTPEAHLRVYFRLIEEVARQREEHELAASAAAAAAAEAPMR
jgi:glycosyltransferase involved in cell wall biosynthesis